jgi:hypothetical protein
MDIVRTASDSIGPVLDRPMKYVSILFTVGRLGLAWQSSEPTVAFSVGRPVFSWSASEVMVGWRSGQTQRGG